MNGLHVHQTESPVKALVQGMRSQSSSIRTSSLLSIYDLGVPGAAVLSQHNVFQELKVMLYTEKEITVQVAVIRALESFVLGMQRVGTPDQDMVEEIVSRLRSNDEDEQVRDFYDLPSMCRLLVQVRMTLMDGHGRKRPHSSSLR